MKSKLCEICKKEFIPTSPRQRFCRECGILNRREKGRLRQQKCRQRAKKGERF